MPCVAATTTATTICAGDLLPAEGGAIPEEAGDGGQGNPADLAILQARGRPPHRPLSAGQEGTVEERNAEEAAREAPASVLISPLMLPPQLLSLETTRRALSFERGSLLSCLAVYWARWKARANLHLMDIMVRVCSRRLR